VTEWITKQVGPIRIQMKVRPSLEKVKRTFSERLKKINDASIPNKKAAIFLDRWVQKNFQSQGGKVGGWEAIDRAGKILQDTGRLRSSFIPFAKRSDAGIGSSLKYSKPHDQGVGNMPKRQILPERSDVEDDLFQIYDKHVHGLTREPLW